jgi:ribosomal protein L35
VQTKIKPKKSAVKRFKVTSTGKLLHSHSGKQHLAVKKSGELRCRSLCVPSFQQLFPSNPITPARTHSLSQGITSVPFRDKRSSGDQSVERVLDCAHAMNSDADATSIKRLLALR